MNEAEEKMFRIQEVRFSYLYPHTIVDDDIYTFDRHRITTPEGNILSIQGCYYIIGFCKIDSRVIYEQWINGSTKECRGRELKELLALIGKANLYEKLRNLYG